MSHSSTIAIRPETPADIPAVFAVNKAAFETDAEARLVDALRVQASPVISLVAVDHGGTIVGHIMFSPVILSTAPQLRIAGLAPVAVQPDMQRSGVGTFLIRAGLDACRAAGFEACVLLGHPEYYPRFGFGPSIKFGFKSEYDVPPEAFMALELRPGAFPKSRDELGVARYHAAFAAL